MNKRESNNINDRASGLSTVAGSLLGTVGANAAIGKFNELKATIDENVVVQQIESDDEVVVVSHSNGQVQGNFIEQTIHELTPAPGPGSDSFVVYPEPNLIIEDVYAGPAPEPIDPDIDPINCIYGPPEPDPFPDIDVTNEDLFADV